MADILLEPTHRGEPLTQGSVGSPVGRVLTRRPQAAGRGATALRGRGGRRVRKPVTWGRHLRQPPKNPCGLGHCARRHYRLAPSSDAATGAEELSPERLRIAAARWLVLRRSAGGGLRRVSLTRLTGAEICLSKQDCLLGQQTWLLGQQGERCRASIGQGLVAPDEPGRSLTAAVRNNELALQRSGLGCPGRT